MAETPRSVQAAPLEIPVTIQGSRTVEGSDQRELFVESTKTTLVFDSGAVLSLKTKVAPGQCVFLRNEETGKEILCKILESRQQGDSNYADLEFTVYEPDFWNGHKESDETAEPKSEAQKKVEAAVAKLAPEKSEAAAPAAEGTPARAPEALLPAHEMQAPEEVKATAAEKPEAEEPAAGESGETHAQAEQESAGEAAHAAEAELAEMDPAEAIAASPEAGAEAAPEPKKKKRQRPPRPPNFKARKIAAAVSVTAAILVISYQVYTWRARIFHWNRGPAHSATAKKTAKAAGTTAAATSAPTPAPTPKATAPAPAATNSVKAAPTPTPFPLPTAGEAKGAAISARALATPVKTVESGKATRGRQPAASRAAKLSKPEAPDAPEIVPVQIVSQPQPSMPPWAKKLDLDGVVKLDAVIDQNGNISQTTPISGPPILQHAAEQAVALWIFHPATQDGKPVPSHLVLTVEFQSYSPTAK